MLNSTLRYTNRSNNNNNIKRNTPSQHCHMFDGCCNCGFFSPSKRPVLLLLHISLPFSPLCRRRYIARRSGGGSYGESPSRGMSTKQDYIIRHVANHVAKSCNGAAYYQKLREQTKFNVNFNFLDEAHPFYPYYEFLVQSWRESGPTETTSAAAGDFGMDGGSRQPYGADTSARYNYYPRSIEVVPEIVISTPAAPQAATTCSQSRRTAANRRGRRDDEDDYELVEVNGVKGNIRERNSYNNNKQILFTVFPHISSSLSPKHPLVNGCSVSPAYRNATIP
eukprot:gene196-107_t